LSSLLALKNCFFIKSFKWNRFSGWFR